jgi:hypothetical protein
LSQRGVRVRVLIIDDASPDHTAEVGARLAAEDPRVEFRRHVVNLGHISTYNEGLLGWATGDYSLLLSADDLLTPGALARAARLFDAHSEVELVYGRQILLDSDTPARSGRPICDDEVYRVLDGRSFLASLCASGQNPVNTPTAIVRTRTLEKVGGYRADLPHTADMELWLRLAVHGSVGILEAEQAFKRMHGRNMQLEYTTGAARDLEGRKAAFDVFFLHWGDRVASPAPLHAHALRALGEEAFWAASNAFDRGDHGNCPALLRFALSLYPEITTRVEWSRYQRKQRLGPRVWSWLKPFVDRVRRNGRKATSGSALIGDGRHGDRAIMAGDGRPNGEAHDQTGFYLQKNLKIP